MPNGMIEMQTVDTIIGRVAKGDPGFSPVITVTEIEGGHRVTVTDVNGSQNFDVMDGVINFAGGQSF